MFLKKCDIYYSKWATVVKKFQLSMTKLGAHDEIRWFDGTGGYPKFQRLMKIMGGGCLKFPRLMKIMADV
jgi:hypothetical protein